MSNNLDAARGIVCALALSAVFWVPVVWVVVR